MTSQISPIIVVEILMKNSRGEITPPTQHIYLDREPATNAVDRYESLHKTMGWYRIHAFYPAIDEYTGQIKLGLPSTIAGFGTVTLRQSAAK